MARTHEVTNQVPPLYGHDVFGGDRALSEAVARHSADGPGPQLLALGRLAGTELAHRWATEANTYPPVLRTHDRSGHRIDEVTFHPAWHELMGVAVSHGLHGAPWAAPRPDAHVQRAAGFLTWGQVESGHGCPISMTYAVLPALRHQPDIAAAYEPGLTSPAYDPGLRDPATKRGLLAGMGMTEKQGGSDVRANTTRAEPSSDGSWRLTGHKWFCSAPMCDVFLVLAQAPAGLSCFLVPRVLPDGSRNVFALQRLKDKLGNRSNASSEVEFDGTLGWLVGPEGRGVATIIEMVAMTRLDCVLGSAALMRAALTQAIHHAAHRSTFGTLLIDAPLMQSVLVDLALESEAATALAIRLAAAVDNGETAFSRLALAAAKFWVCKRTPYAVGEALETLGGNGYVEESGMPRLYRESPLNSIWEGSGNVIALDVLRAIGRESESVAAVQAELDSALGIDPRFDAAVKDLGLLLAEVGAAEPQDAQGQARQVAGSLALALQGSLLLRYAPVEVSNAFCASRFGGAGVRGGTSGSGVAGGCAVAGVFGALPRGIPLRRLVERARVGS
ncbi:MAG: acyl-CoA dehydrogenase family protein [Actinomycetota bacterium]|nr:acyl-CoA dehydrogenase family protein [Actinomycetota bacterium]